MLNKLDKTIDIPAQWPASFTGTLRIQATDEQAVTLWLTRDRAPFVGQGGQTEHAMKTLPAPQAIELRDALLEVYPVEPKQETTYTVEKGNAFYGPEWRVQRKRLNVPTTLTDQVAVCHDETTARGIAAALEAK